MKISNCFKCHWIKTENCMHHFFLLHFLILWICCTESNTVFANFGIEIVNFVIRIKADFFFSNRNKFLSMLLFRFPSISSKAFNWFQLEQYRNSNESRTQTQTPTQYSVLDTSTSQTNSHYNQRLVTHFTNMLICWYYLFI